MADWVHTRIKMRNSPTEKEMVRAHHARDASYDGIFWVCVHSTGIFCLPSCPAKTPLDVNVTYVPSVQDAILVGLRPCKRCHPTETAGQPVKWVRKLLRLSEENKIRRLTDADLRAAAIDPVRARRYFRKHFGMTFHAYHRARRLGLALKDLKRGSNLLGAGLDHGYESDSGFRDAFSRQFGTTPGRSDKVSHIVMQSIESPVGRFALGATERGVCLMEFSDRRALPTEMAFLQKRFGCPIVPGTHEYTDRIANELGRYFDGSLTEFTTPLDMIGTPFQQSVWDELCRIPYGQTISYGELASRVGRPGAQRAVGQANGANRIAIAIPCHRVVQSNGKLRGYGGGLWRKQFLLDLETSQMALAL